MKSNVESYKKWYRQVVEAEEPENKEFGLEGGGQHGVIMCVNSNWKEGQFTGAQRYFSSRGETRPSRGTYDQHIYYSPDEFQGWEQGPAFQDFDTRGLRYYWKDLSGGNPVSILIPGTGEIVHHKGAEHIAYEEVYKELAGIPEFQQIMKAKQSGRLGNIPKEIIMSLKAKTQELDIDSRSRDIFDRGVNDNPEFVKAMVKRCWAMGLVD
jgi:hypothetical protein